MDSKSVSPMSSTKLRSEMPFEDLPNLPKPIIPKIDLGIKRIDLEDLLQIKPSFTGLRKIGYSVADNGTQTDQSDILDLKYVIEMLRTLTLDTGQLRRDLTFAQSMLKANYEKQISDRSAELYCRVNERLSNYEKVHKKKMETVRKSYQTQFEDAIQSVAGDYKTYYNEVMQGKTGRHDVIIEELKDQVMQQELITRQHVAKIEELQKRLQIMKEETDTTKSVSPTSPPGVSLEEAEEMEKEIDNLKDEVIQLNSDLATQEDENNELNKQIENLNKQLNDQKNKYKQLEKDNDSFKKKTQQEKDKAAKLAESQLAVMEKEMKAKMEQAEREAAEKSQEQAELQRMRDQAKHMEEIHKRKSMEEELQAEAAQQQPTTTMNTDDNQLLAEIEALRDIEKKHKNTIIRLEKELEKSNKMWELKLMVMRKNFHSLKDEFFIRNTLKRQSATLQHSTIGYAMNGDVYKDSHHPPEERRSIPNLKFNNSTVTLLKDSTPTIPPPSPNNLIIPQSPRFVHFGDEFPIPFPPRPITGDNQS